MTLNTWWLFVAMTFVVSATPGPNMMLVMSASARYGWRPAIITMMGCMAALLTMMSISAAGLGTLLLAFPKVFHVLQWIGAAYLAYLGVKCWRSPVQDNTPKPDAELHTERVANTSGHAHFRQGVLVAASNPKAILFAAAFLPQFMNPHQAQLPQFVILLSTFSVIEVAWYFVYALSGDRLSRYLQRAAVMRWFNRVTGGVFVGFAALMAMVRE